MLLERSPLRFSQAEAARALALPQEVVDALVRTHVIETRDGALSVSSLERLLRDSLLRLYRAEARAGEVEITLEDDGSAKPEPEQTFELELEADPDSDLIVQSLAESQADAASRRRNQRIVPRYKPRRQLGGTFRQTRFTILQLSGSGLRIRHDDTLRPGEEARMTFSLVNPARTFALKARVVWTSIAQRGNGPSFCISGLTAVGSDEPLHEAIRVLLAVRELEADDTATPTPQTSIGNLAALSDDEVASIIRTLRLLTSDPVEANRWYTRARFALADEQVRADAPVRARDREEALAVWEYLGRRIELKAVAAVLAWIRTTRSAAAVPHA